MSSNSKKFVAGLAAAFVLGVVSAATPVLAAEITETFATNDTLTAAKMNAIKNAANDTNTRLGTAEGTITTLGTRVTALENCPANMTRVASVCVDNTRVSNGNVAWQDAVGVCRTAGKRLLTPGEYVAALNSGSFADMVSATPNQFEWVDAVSSTTSTGATDGTSFGRLTAGYMGPDNGTILLAGEIFFATNAAYDAVFSFIGYRCAR